MLTAGFPPLLAAAVYALIPAACCLFVSKGLIHFFQIDSYQFPSYFRTLRRNPVLAIGPGVYACIVSMLLYWISCGFSQASFPVRIGILVLLIGLSVVLGLLVGKKFSSKKVKKKMVYTPRLKRLYFVYFLVLLSVGLILSLFASPLFAMLMPLLLPAIFCFAGLLAWPVEKLISELYFRDARRKLLANPNLIRIGITGSYGKTSVKHILGAILAEKYPVLYTPASFNTPMGVTRTIRGELGPEHRIFIAEMGARHKGDIKELCRLVHPQIGIITSVGPQHLETFHSIENIATGKYELIQALPESDSHSYFWNDSAFCTQMYEHTQKPKTLCAFTSKEADHYISEMSVTPRGSNFVLNLGKFGSIQCTTKLLGDHNIQNILLAASVAADLGLTLKQIANAVSRLRPVEHRLQLLTNPSGYTVIDDAFNTNPVSAAKSLRVLSEFPGRKIVITPGMVELGTKEAEYNRKFGKQIASAADIAIIIGKKHADPIVEGIKEAGFSEQNLYRVTDLDESTAVLRSICAQGDVVLYENDLPDNYRE